MNYLENETALKELEELLIPTDSFKQKLDGVVDSAPPDKGYEVLVGKLTHGKWKEND